MNRNSCVYVVPLALLILSACQNESAPVTPSLQSTEPAVSPPPAPMLAATLSDYTSSPIDHPVGGNCALDLINGERPASTALAAGHEVTFGGWMGNESGEVPGDAKLVFSGLSGSYSVPVTGEVDRPDVAQALGQPGLAKSGFNVVANMNVAPGNYNIFIVHGGETPRACALNTEIVFQ